MAIDTGSKLITDARAAEGVVTAVVTGDVTVMNAPDARMALSTLIRSGEPTKLMLDMGAVRYVDSSGLAVLVEARRNMSKEASFVLVAMTDEVKGLMKIMNLHALFEFADTMPDAP